MKNQSRPNGTTIRALRLANHLSNSELARRAGVSRQYMGRIQAGSRGASEVVIQNIARVFDVPPEAICQDAS